VITAQEVRDIQKKAILECILEHVEDDIHDAIGTGKFRVEYVFSSVMPESVRNNAITTLETLGFNVQHDAQKTTLIIGWNIEGGLE
jgi:hypothetical protein